MNKADHKLSILIVDDTPLQAIDLRRILIQEGYSIKTAKDGIEALEFMKLQNFALVFSDIDMPNMNGYELCHAIKSNPLLRKIPVVLCSDLMTPKVLVHSIEVGANSYTSRPYFPNTIAFLVEYLINSQPSFPLLFENEEIIVEGEKYLISTEHQYIISFLLSTCLNIQRQQIEHIQTKKEVQEAYQLLENAKKEVEHLFLNMFPEKVAQELIAYGTVQPVKFDETSVMFVDFAGFTNSIKTLTPQVILEILSFYFDNFDLIISKHNLERIKVIEQGYLCAGGMTKDREKHAINCANAALAIQQFLQNPLSEIRQKYQISWEARIGIDSGPVIGGVVGKNQFAYDIWGDTVNKAKNLTILCKPGKVTISTETLRYIKGLYLIESRGPVPFQNNDGVEQEEEIHELISINPNVLSSKEKTHDGNTK